MKKISLGGYKKNTIIRGYAIVDDEDFEFLNKYKWHLLIKNGMSYAISMGVKKRYPVRMHRLILNAQGRIIVDHKNRNGLDNRRENLRLCNNAENLRNRTAQCNSKTGYKGVFPMTTGNRFYSQLTHNGERIHVGTFETAEQAALAYDNVAKKYHKEFACLNKVKIL